MNEELKPCPCCGTEVQIDTVVEPHTHTIAKFMPDVTGYTAFVCCQRCGIGMGGKEKETRKAAITDVIDKWNTRAEKTCKWKLQPENEYGEQYFYTSCDIYFHRDIINSDYEYCPGCGGRIER